MTTLHESQPFSLLMHQEIKGANGLGITHAQTELFDNSFDAGSQFATCVITKQSPVTKKCYKVDFDHGEGIKDLGALFNLSNEVKKKAIGNRGLKNKGHRSALGRFNPAHITYVSKVAGSKPTFLEFDLGKMIESVDEEMKGSCNYRNVDALSYIQQTRSRTEDIKSRLEDVISLIPDEIIKGQLQSIFDGKTDHFFLQIMEYSSLPERLEDDLKECMTSCKLYYYQALLDGKEFNYLPSDGILVRLCKKDALNPLGDPTKFPRLLSTIDIREIDGGTLLQVKIGVEGVTPENEKKIFWLTDSQSIINDKRSKILLLTSERKSWAKTPSVTMMEIRTSCISKDAQQYQINKLDKLFGVDELRGLYCMYIDRILGIPIWGQSSGWGSQRNMGGIRALVNFTDHVAAEKYMSIQCEKHRTNITNVNPVVSKLFDHLIANIAKFHSHYSKPESDLGVKQWNLNTEFYIITEQAPPAPSSPVPTPPAPSSPVPTPPAPSSPLPTPPVPTHPAPAHPAPTAPKPVPPKIQSKLQRALEGLHEEIVNKLSARAAKTENSKRSDEDAAELIKLYKKILKRFPSP